MQGVLTRTYGNPTFGSMVVTNSGPSGFDCHTLELPWLDDKPDVSCIPEGVYKMIRHSSVAHPNVWQLSNVPGRSEILIHNGNTETDSLGCIIVGYGADTSGTVLGTPAVLESDAALSGLMNFTAGAADGWLLTVTS